MPVGEFGTRIFVRDDDVGALTPSLTEFIETFVARRIPVSYQIIPEKLTAQCAAFMRSIHATHPMLVEFGQHGLRHEMMAGGKRVFYEFGPERRYADQLADIAAGQTILRDLLGNQISTRVFTPPRHRYDRNTLHALKTLGFAVLSASCYPGFGYRVAYGAGRLFGLTNIGRSGVPHHGSIRPDSGLFELSIAVAVDDGSAIAASVDAIFASIAKARRHTPDIGLMLHHDVYRSPTDRMFLVAFADRLAELPDATFHGIGELHAAYTIAEMFRS